MNKEVFDKVCDAARNQKPHAVSALSSAQGSLSFGIVNSRNNGKRLSISKALASALGLTDKIALSAVPEMGVVMIACELPFDSTIRGELRGDEKKLWYNSGVVLLLTELFSIDFDKHVSRSYGDISINDLDGVPVATIRITQGAAAEDKSA